MYEFVFSQLKKWGKIPTFTCTEQSDHWKKFYENPPKTILEVNEKVMERFRK